MQKFKRQKYVQNLLIQCCPRVFQHKHLGQSVGARDWSQECASNYQPFYSYYVRVNIKLASQLLQLNTIIALSFNILTILKQKHVDATVKLVNPKMLNS